MRGAKHGGIAACSAGRRQEQEGLVECGSIGGGIAACSAGRKGRTAAGGRVGCRGGVPSAHRWARPRRSARSSGATSGLAPRGSPASTAAGAAARRRAPPYCVPAGPGLPPSAQPSRPNGEIARCAARAYLRESVGLGPCAQARRETGTSSHWQAPSCCRGRSGVTLAVIGGRWGPQVQSGSGGTLASRPARREGDRNALPG